jgi:hypothetical protein
MIIATVRKIRLIGDHAIPSARFTERRIGRWLCQHKVGADAVVYHDERAEQAPAPDSPRKCEELAVTTAPIRDPVHEIPPHEVTQPCLVLALSSLARQRPAAPRLALPSLATTYFKESLFT